MNAASIPPSNRDIQDKLSCSFEKEKKKKKQCRW